MFSFNSRDLRNLVISEEECGINLKGGGGSLGNLSK